MKNLCNVMMNLNSPSNGLGGQLRPPPQQFNMPPAHTLAPYFAAHFGPHVMAAAQAASAASFSTTPVMTSPVNSGGHSMNMSSGHLSSSGSSSGNSTGNSLGNNSTASTISSPEAEMDKMNKGEKMTRSHQYKKIMKPLLERKRRARINKCLDELKDIMTAALQAQGENVSKLEKADILELTVRHLHKMQQARRLMSTSRNPLEEIHRFQAGYSSCAQEAASFLLSTPGVDITVGQRMLAHLSTNMANPIASALQSSRGTTSTPVHQPLPPAMAMSPPNMNNSRVCQNNSFEDQTYHRTPLRRSSSPNLSPSKRLFHSPPLTSSAKCPQPPRPSSTPAHNSRVSQNNDFEVTVSIFDRLSGTTTSEDEAEGSEGPRIIKPSPIRLNPGFDPVWRPF